MITRRLGPLTLGWLCCAAAWVQEPSARVWIESRSGAWSSQPLAGFEWQGWSNADALALRIDGLAEPDDALRPAERDAACTLASGDRCRASVAGGEGDVLRLDLACGPRLELEIEDLRSLVFTQRVSAAALPTLVPAPIGDRLYWARGANVERVDGTIEAFEAEGVRFESVLGSRRFPWIEIAALFVEVLPSTAQVRESHRVCVELADGGRLRGTLRRLDSARVQLAVDARQTLELPLAHVAEVTLDDGSVAYLSELTPVATREGWLEEGEPGMRWPFQVDRAVTGGWLTAGGKAWRRGLGVHAPSRLEFDLAGAWSRLRGSVAIDDSVLMLRDKGSVRFAISADERPEPLWRSAPVRGGEAPVQLPDIDLQGVRRLILEVEMDERSFVADRANWLRMQLVR